MGNLLSMEDYGRDYWFMLWKDSAGEDGLWRIQPLLQA